MLPAGIAFRTMSSLGMARFPHSQSTGKIAARPTSSSSQELSMAALREPRNIEDAAKAKELLLRARAAEAAVWVLPDPDFLEDACRLLTGAI